VASGGVRGSRVPKKYKGIVLFARDAFVALLLVGTILFAMYAYTGLWPPLVVVESNSMMHTEDNTSSIGVIDTGDMVLVKDIGSVDDVVTYVEGFVSGHRTYGDYGDVVVYNSGGDDSSTAIIHRAILYLMDNGDGTYSCEALQYLPDGKWRTSNSGDTWDSLTSTLTINDVGYRELDVGIRVDRMHGSGFITKGDHNTAIDQDQSISSYRPVDLDWVVGKARGELPWFGLLKLWVTDTLGSPSPPNSVTNLIICMTLIVVGPILADVYLTNRTRRRIAAKREAARQEHAQSVQTAQVPPPQAIEQEQEEVPPPTPDIEAPVQPPEPEQ
jgi:signal peptidase